MKGRIVLLFSLVWLLLATGVPAGAQAQDTQWKALNAQVRELYRQGHYERALLLAEQALEFAEKNAGPDHSFVTTSLNNLASLHSILGAYERAEPLYKRSLEISERTLGANHADRAVPLNNLALLYEIQGRYALAEPLYKRSLAIFEKTLGPDHPNLAAGLSNLAGLYEHQGDYALAEPLYMRSLEIQERAYGPSHPNVGATLNNLALLYFSQGRYVLAEPICRRSLEIAEDALGPDHPNVATSLFNLATLYQVQEGYAQAEQLSARALAIREKVYGSDHPLVATISRRFTKFRGSMKRPNRFTSAPSAFWKKQTGRIFPCWPRCSRTWRHSTGGPAGTRRRRTWKNGPNHSGPRCDKRRSTGHRLRRSIVPCARVFNHAAGRGSVSSVMFSCLATISSPRSKSARAEPEMACR